MRTDEVRNTGNSEGNDFRIFKIALEDIIINSQVREEFNDDYIQELANNIQERGLFATNYSLSKPS